MNTPSPFAVSVSLAFFLALGAAAGQPATEKIPPDKVIHPLLRESAPQVMPETKKNPVYPEKWRKRLLGGKVILLAEVRKSGRVGRIDPLTTELRVETECAPTPPEGPGKGSGAPETKGAAGAEGSGTAGMSVPPEANRDFETAAIEAVKQWKYRPATRNGDPVDILYAIIVEFTSCPKDPGENTARPH